MSSTATRAYCRTTHLQASLFLYYSTQSTFCNAHNPRLSSARRAYATISSETETVEEEQPPPHPLKNPFPYPPHPKPTAHQIFHLRAGATQGEIKARYYELVKSHHPDSQYAAHLEPDVAHSRFRAIQASYDFLRGRTIAPHPNAPPTPPGTGLDPYMNEMARRRRAYYMYRSVPDDDGNGTKDGKAGWGGKFAPDERTIWHEDGWRERIVFAFGVVAVIAGLFPSMPFTIASTFLPMSPPASPYVPPLPASYSPSSSSSSSSSSPEPPPSSSTSDNAEPSNAPSNSFSFPFSVDLDKGHRKAVSALSQAHSDREEYGIERRENMRKRVQDMSSDDHDLAKEKVPREEVDTSASVAPGTPQDRKSSE